MQADLKGSMNAFILSWKTLIPIDLLTSLGLAVVIVRWDKETHRTLAVVAAVFTVLSAIDAAWGLSHVNLLRSRAASDYRFEISVWLLTASAVMFGGVWLWKARGLSSVVFLAAAAWLFCIFSLIVISI